MQKCTFLAKMLFLLRFGCCFCCFSKSREPGDVASYFYFFLIRRLVKKLFHFEVMFRKGACLFYFTSLGSGKLIFEIRGFRASAVVLIRNAIRFRARVMDRVGFTLVTVTF